MNEFGVNFDIVGEQATRHSENGDPIYYSNFTQHTRNGDRIVWVYEADLTIRWTNADNPDETLEVTLHAIGTNDGGPDKAKGSAWTYCLKYYLFEKFGIDQGDDDPDMSDHSSEPPQQSQKQHTGAQNGNRQGNTQPQAQNGQTGRSGAARPLSDAQLSRLYRKGEDAGYSQQSINGHWDGFVHADVPLEDKGTKIDTLAKAQKWAIDNGYTSEFSKVYWPKIKDGSGRIFWLSTVGAATMQRVDLSHDGVPFESPSNKEIMATSQYFGEGSKSRGFDQETANKLNEKGITTACFWGGRWVLWGPHTAAYKYNGSMDARAIFDVNIRMLEHITNSFQKDHGTEIDSPMTPQDKDSVLNFEKEKLDTLLGIGALIGTPSVEFVESANPTSNMLNGDFVWDFSVTNTPPFKSGTARVCYTDEGFQSFFATE